MYNNKRIGLIIPTRYGSERLNGKVLCDIAGKKQIEWIVQRAKQSKYIDDILFAITDKEEENKPILDFLYQANLGVLIYKGAHDNIIKRCLESAFQFNIDIIVDTSHDCTFFDSYLADKLIERLFEYNADYSANCITRTFPDGFDIQVYTKEMYKKAYNTIHRHNYYSGWNIWHAREDIFPKPRIINLEAEKEYYYPHWHLCLDTEQDKILIENILNFFIKHGIYYPKYIDIINYLKYNPKLLEINKSVMPTKLKIEGTI